MLGADKVPMFSNPCLQDKSSHIGANINVLGGARAALFEKRENKREEPLKKIEMSPGTNGRV